MFGNLEKYGCFKGYDGELVEELEVFQVISEASCMRPSALSKDHDHPV
jgi:hypothetical protein